MSVTWPFRRFVAFCSRCLDWTGSKGFCPLCSFCRDYVAERGCTVVWWLAPSPHSERVPGSIPTWGLSVWSLHVLPVYAWVLSGYSGFLPLSKIMHVWLTGDSKSSLGVSVLVCSSLCGPVTDWGPRQGVPCLSPNHSWDRLQPPCNPELD